MEDTLKQDHVAHHYRYSLTQDHECVHIHLPSSWAPIVARKVAEAAYAHRNEVTETLDQRVIGEFIPYDGKREWGYGKCLSVLNTGDPTETWSIMTPSIKDPHDLCPAVSALVHNIFSLRALFAALHDEDGLINKTAQRLHVSLPVKEGSMVCLRVDLSASATEALSLIQKRDALFVHNALRSAQAKLLSPSIERKAAEPLAITPGFILDKETRVFTIKSLGEKHTSVVRDDGSSFFELPPSVIVQMHLCVCLVGLAALDACLADVMRPPSVR